MSLRTSLARSVPAPLRKAVRMAEHYARRHREWVQILGEMRGATKRDSALLWASALACPVTALTRLDGFEPPVLLGDIAVHCVGTGTFYPRKGTDDIIHILNAREPHVRSALEDWLRPGDVFVDAGANIGYFSIIAARVVGVHGRVIAVEMMPQTAARLRLHTEANAAGTVTIIENALSDRAGDTVTATRSPQKHGQASITIGNSSDRTISVTVKTVTLEAVLTDIPRVRLIKMDLEGAEFLALSGAGAALDRIDAIVFENNSEDSRIPDLLASRGFTVSGLSGHDYLAQRVPISK